MMKFQIVLIALGALAMVGCTTEEGAVTGAVAGSAIGGVATHSVGGAIVGAGIGALAGAVLVSHTHDGRCTYRYNGHLYHEPCHD